MYLKVVKALDLGLLNENHYRSQLRTLVTNPYLLGPRICIFLSRFLWVGTLLCLTNPFLYQHYPRNSDTKYWMHLTLIYNEDFNSSVAELGTKSSILVYTFPVINDHWLKHC